MFLSRVELNSYRRETMRALGSPQIMHAAVMASFDSFSSERSDERVLWRIDRVGPSTYLLIQSGDRPDLHHIVDQFGRPDTGQTGDTIDYEPFLSGIESGQTWRFRLRANPVRNVPSGEPNVRGKVCHHVTSEQQLKWLLDRSEGLGVSMVNDGIPTVSIVQREKRTFDRKGSKVTISMVTFEGVLTVVDRDRFLQSLRNGIGRAKAYGCGMITIARP